MTAPLTISQALQLSDRLAEASRMLDAQLLLAHALNCSPAYLRTWPEKALAAAQQDRYLALLDQRAQGHPVAHLIGEQAFWTLNLEVSPETLIPRADTECLVEQALLLDLPEDARVLDLGTGTGAIALALASEHKEWKVTASDFSAQIIALAERNAQRHALTHVRFFCSVWFDALPLETYDLIISNPPYIAPNDAHLSQGDLRFEAQTALVADAQGLADIQTIVANAPGYLKPNGYLMLEHGYDQAQAVQTIMYDAGFTAVHSEKDYGGNVRLTMGVRPA
jgi:release factor glutamine methyltransferase